VSSILDALAKVEGARPRAPLDLTLPPLPRRNRAVAIVIALLAAFLVGVGATLSWRRGGVPPASGAPRISPPIPIAATAELPPVPPVRLPPAELGTPWGRELAGIVPAPPAAAPAPVARAAEVPSPVAITISFLAYSPQPERRSVSLAVDGGSLVTLREGESAGGLRVARILPDRVEIEHAGVARTVRAPQ
jgi:hypothetical protein